MSRGRLFDNAGEEPALFDLLADPVTHAVMRRDGVTLADLCTIIKTARHRLQLSDDLDDGESGTSPEAGWPNWRCHTEPCCLSYA
jgi:hypothetical protein